MTHERPHILPPSFLGEGARLHHIHDPGGLMVDPHHHLHHEWDYILGGQGVFAVGASRITVQTGDLVYLARGVYHWRKSDPAQPLVLCNLVLDDHSMRRILAPSPRPRNPDFPWWYRWTPQELSAGPHRMFLRRLLSRMRRGPEPLSPSDVQRLLPGLARLLTLSHQRQADHPALQQVAQRIRSAPEAPLSLQTEADRLGVSRWWLSRIFKRHFGISLWEHRDFARVDLAILKLLQSDIPIRDLGHQMGFAGTAQFINTFKRITGFTPQSFRQHYRRK